MPLDPSWIDALFSRFEAMYGQQFVDKWKNMDIAMVKQEWANALHGMNGETIKLALQACRENNIFPPSLPEFYQLCKAVRIMQTFQKLSKPEYPKKKAKENIAKIKQMLQGFGAQHITK